MVNLIVEYDNYRKIVESLKFLKENSVYVGIPDETTERENEEKNEVTNAELLYIHTNGSPVNNIPPRPVIEPAIYKDRDRLSRMLADAASLQLKGQHNDAIQQLKRTGQRAESVCRRYFVDPENGWPPNSPSTIAYKKSKHKGKDYNPRPLIDTGELRKSITYFVELKGRGRIK